MVVMLLMLIVAQLACLAACADVEICNAKNPDLCGTVIDTSEEVVANTADREEIFNMIQVKRHVNARAVQHSNNVDSMSHQMHCIPNRLLMNHKANLLQDPYVDRERGNNVKNTVSFLNKNGITDVQFLDDHGCVDAIKEAHSEELADYFIKEKVGMYKSDICRLAQLFLHGGWYMDTDIQLLVPLQRLPTNAAFVSVISLPWKGPRDPNEIFQAFVGAAPGHPVIKKSLEMCSDYYAGRNETLQALMGGDMKGTILMRLAYEDWLGQKMEAGLQEHANDQEFRHAFMLEEERLDGKYPGVSLQQGVGNNCNIGIIDRRSKTVFAFSHTVCQAMPGHDWFVDVHRLEAEA